MFINIWRFNFNMCFIDVFNVIWDMKNYFRFIYNFGKIMRVNRYCDVYGGYWVIFLLFC